MEEPRAYHLPGLDRDKTLLRFQTQVAAGQSNTDFGRGKRRGKPMPEEDVVECSGDYSPGTGDVPLFHPTNHQRYLCHLSCLFSSTRLYVGSCSKKAARCLPDHSTAWRGGGGMRHAPLSLCLRVDASCAAPMLAP